MLHHGVFGIVINATGINENKALILPNHSIIMTIAGNPGVGSTIALRDLVILLNKVDFPTLGRPIRATMEECVVDDMF